MKRENSPPISLTSNRQAKHQQYGVAEPRLSNRGETKAASCLNTYISCLAFNCDRKVSINIGLELNHVWFRAGECGNLECSLDAMINCDHVRQICTGDDGSTLIQRMSSSCFHAYQINNQITPSNRSSTVIQQIHQVESTTASNDTTQGRS